MKRYYANLLGNWTDITDEGTVGNGQKPSAYFEDMLTYEDGSNVAECFKYGYVLVEHKNRQYRIDPSCIQIVDE